MKSTAGKWRGASMELSGSTGNVTLRPGSTAVFSSQCALRSLLFLELQVQVYMFYSFLEGKKSY